MPEPTATKLNPKKILLALHLSDEVLSLLMKYQDFEVAGYVLQNLIEAAPLEVKEAMAEYHESSEENLLPNTEQMTEMVAANGLPDRTQSGLINLLTQLFGGRPAGVQIIPLSPLPPPNALRETLIETALRHDFAYEDPIQRKKENAESSLQEVQTTLNELFPPSSQTEEEMRASTRALLDDIESIDPDKI